MMVGGEALPTALAGELRRILPDRFTNMYGPTETTIWSLVHEIADVGDGSIPIGRPIGNNTVFVLDDEPVAGCRSACSASSTSAARVSPAATTAATS